MNDKSIKNAFQPPILKQNKKIKVKEIVPFTLIWKSHKIIDRHFAIPIHKEFIGLCDFLTYMQGYTGILPYYLRKFLYWF